MTPKTKIFTIYAWEDKNAQLQLLRHLKPFEEDFDLSFWHDDPINTGQVWKPKDEARLIEADIFLLLVSANFMNSEFIKQLEFKNIIDRYKENKSVVIPIILEYCRWEIDFKSDDYNFNLNELQVLPGDGKPLENWGSPELAFNNIASNLKKVINSFSKDGEHLELVRDASQVIAISRSEDQIAINFNEENDADKKYKEENKASEELQLKKDIEEQQRIKAIKKAEGELKLRQEAEEKKRLEEEQRILAKSKALRKAEEKKQLKENAKVTKNEVLARQSNFEAKDKNEIEETELDKKNNSKRRIIAGLMIAALAIVGIWAFSFFGKGSDKNETQITKTETKALKDSIALEESKKKNAQEEALANLTIGKIYEGGFVFEIDATGKSGKVARTDDAGPMPWKNAMKIHEQLGEGWRLPTMEELKLMHKTIGQGATNIGEFADELYWSATPYDREQARLVRFSDGNTSYHYNSGGTHRNFRVRAIREFNN